MDRNTSNVWSNCGQS